MSKELFQEIKETADNHGWSVRSYSGRAMYGKTCVGITCNSSTAKVVIAILQDLYHTENNSLMEEAFSLLSNPREDSMGYGRIVYWPDMKWEDSFEESSNDEEEEDA